MTDTLVLIHTVKPLIEVFSRLCAEKLPGVKVFHLLDEPLLEQVRLSGGLQDEHVARLQGHIQSAEQAGAQAVLVTCSTLSPATNQLHAHIPVVKIDEAMVAQAVQAGRKIGVVATNPTTLEPTRALLLAEASKQSKEIDVRMELVADAFQAVLSGDGETHDRLVRQVIALLQDQVDVIVLAQASMARVLDTIPENERRILILTSPHTALERVSRYFPRSN